MSIRDATHVYVCRTAEGVKIGVSVNVTKRSKGLGAGTEIVKTWHRPNKDAHIVERTAFRLIGVAPVRGVEWFDVPAAHAIHAVERAIEMTESGKGMPSANVRREMREEVEMRRFSDALREVSEKAAAIVAEYESNGYVFDRDTMSFVEATEK